MFSPALTMIKFFKLDLDRMGQVLNSTSTSEGVVRTTPYVL